jgi:hypothetical protein
VSGLHRSQRHSKTNTDIQKTLYFSSFLEKYSVLF